MKHEIERLRINRNEAAKTARTAKRYDTRLRAEGRVKAYTVALAMLRELDKRCVIIGGST